MENTQATSQGGEAQSSDAISQGGEAQPQFTADQFNAMQQELRAANEKISGLSKTAETVSRMQKVFAPEEMPVDVDEQFLDTYLQAAVDAEKAGSPIPLTTNLAVKLIEARKTQQQLEDRLKKIENQNKEFQDPNITADRRAYESIDAEMERTLAAMYGAGGYAPQVLTATANLVVEEIKRLKVDNPAAWDAIKRNPDNQRKLVGHFAQKVVPQRYQEAAQREYLSEYKMSAPELMQAFREASQIEDPGQKAKVKESIRQQLLSNIWEGKKQQSTISKLYR